MKDIFLECELPLDEVGGILTEPLPEGGCDIRLRELIKYCDENGINPEDLTDEQIDMFKI
ncbi:MAG: hypothetical protein LUG60_06010 [Erysipelotrichaceae bacterium]|nr:hypothetical protein [Erysipelotrichaceae bacterium]